MDTSAQGDDLYRVHLVPLIRNFKGQSSGTVGERFTVEASSLDQFKSLVTDHVLPFLKREVVFSDDLEPTWSNATVPDREDIDKFVLFYPPSKRTLDFQAIKTNTLQSWLNKQINLLVHRYSNSVSSKAMWNIVERGLIIPAERDRAGAASMSAVMELKSRLKAIHGDTYSSHDIYWHVWANFIHTSEAHIQESLLTQAPPPHIIQLFANTPSNPLIQQRNARLGLQVASNINENFASKFDVMKNLVGSLKRKQNEMNVSLATLESQIDSLQNVSDTNASLIDGFSTSIMPSENEYGRAIIEDIEDANDDDHI
ncbi:hypothetical protein AeRB84_017009 [Aphanomyces euteiches]|nr:hypothetical protein AeRB84_017009 [Aphanomyces euteiches]